MLNKDTIFARKPKIQKTYIESLDNYVYVKEFVVYERNKLRESITDDIHSITLILGVCDESGEPLFTTDDIEDIKKMPQVVADELLTSVIDFNDNKDKKASAKN